MKKIFLGLVALSLLVSQVSFATLPTLILKNQFGEQSNNVVLGGTCSLPASSAHTVLSNLTSGSATALANTYSDVSTALSATMSPLVLASPAITGTPTVAGSKASDTAFIRTCQITSAAASTAVHCLADADIGTGLKAYLATAILKVNGGTLWGTTATCTIQDTNGTPVVFATADMTAAPGGAQALSFLSSSGITPGAAFYLGTGGTASKGLDIKCNATGTGSTLVVTMSGYMK